MGNKRLRAPSLRWVALRVVVAAVLACVVGLGTGCGKVQVDDGSPQVADVKLVTVGQQTESSQGVEIKLVFDRQISASADVADDFVVLLNDSAIDEDVVRLEVRASADSVTFSVHPAEGAALGPGSGSFFALYQGQFSVQAARDDGALPSVTGTGGSCAVLPQPVQGTLPSGLSIEVLSSIAGSSDDGTVARTTFKVTSPAMVRAITWFSPDGGRTKLLKHNHLFAAASAADCAADLAQVVNEAAGLGIAASAQGDEVRLIASEVVDGQIIEPVVVEGVGVQGGSYDAAQGTEAGSL